MAKVIRRIFCEEKKKEDADKKEEQVVFFFPHKSKQKSCCNKDKIKQRIPFPNIRRYFFRVGKEWGIGDSHCSSKQKPDIHVCCNGCEDKKGNKQGKDIFKRQECFVKGRLFIHIKRESMQQKKAIINNRKEE